MGLYFTRNDFDTLHKVGRINWDANGQSPDPCFNYKDIKWFISLGMQIWTQYQDGMH